ncbi:uncharacterized protein [Antedon mediterranea]|uniref:uncharacterized protein n=1 Tax=Antedon mediterranea TaxID=105859 RepID=UPI003AF959E5
MTVFAQIPQYFIFGASEILTNITGMEFAYSQAPKVLQGVLLGLYLFTAGLGCYLGSLLVIIVNAATKGHEWYPDEINDGYLERYYILLAVLLLVNTGIFAVIGHYYTYVDNSVPITEPPDDEISYNGDISFTSMKIDELICWRDKVLPLQENLLSEYEM